MKFQFFNHSNNHIDSVLEALSASTSFIVFWLSSLTCQEAISVKAVKLLAHINWFFANEAKISIGKNIWISRLKIFNCSSRYRDYSTIFSCLISGFQVNHLSAGYSVRSTIVSHTFQVQVWCSTTWATSSACLWSPGRSEVPRPATRYSPTAGTVLNPDPAVRTA